MVIVLFNKHGLSACCDQIPRWAHVDSLDLGNDVWDVIGQSSSLLAMAMVCYFPSKTQLCKNIPDFKTTTTTKQTQK